MTITILKQTKDQKVARPFNRATGTDEALWILVYHAAYEANKHLGFSKAQTFGKVAAEAASLSHPGPVVWGNIDSEKPVLVIGTDKFYAFTEA